MRGAIKVFQARESHRPVAVDGCLELQSVNNPAVKQGSPPCGINKTEELVKGMVEGRNTSSLPLMNVQQCLEKRRRFFLQVFKDVAPKKAEFFLPLKR